jgi:hypothetical protein
MIIYHVKYNQLKVQYTTWSICPHLSTIHYAENSFHVAPLLYILISDNSLTLQALDLRMVLALRAGTSNGKSQHPLWLSPLSHITYHIHIQYWGNDMGMKIPSFPIVIFFVWNTKRIETIYNRHPRDSIAPCQEKRKCQTEKDYMWKLSMLKVREIHTVEYVQYTVILFL